MGKCGIYFPILLEAKFVVLIPSVRFRTIGLLKFISGTKKAPIKVLLK